MPRVGSIEEVCTVSLALAPRHLAWLDERRRYGSLSRSAALRLALDALIRLDLPATADLTALSKRSS